MGTTWWAWSLVKPGDFVEVVGVVKRSSPEKMGMGWGMNRWGGFELDLVIKSLNINVF